MKKIKYIMLACLLTASLGIEAKSMKDLLVSMPDEMMPTTGICRVAGDGSEG